MQLNEKQQHTARHPSRNQNIEVHKLVIALALARA
jgi:hypothetical protein